jgi:DNA-directed RNA polymerase subunit M/transcription elongation factor TFIIS
MNCPKCSKRMGTRKRDLWYPEQPEARLKCDKCGEWSTMRELGITAELERQRIGKDNVSAARAWSV